MSLTLKMHYSHEIDCSNFHDEILIKQSICIGIRVFTVLFNPNGDWYTVFFIYKELKSKISDQSDQK